MRRSFFSFAFIALILSSCATAKVKKEEFDKGYKAADADCLEVQKNLANHISNLQEELKEKNDRLRRYNQVDSNNKLYPLKKYRGHLDPEEVTGDEPWMK